MRLCTDTIAKRLKLMAKCERHDGGEIKLGLRWWTIIFHFTNRRAGAHNHAKFVDWEALIRELGKPARRDERILGTYELDICALRFSR
jgi:hypothetical protein